MGTELFPLGFILITEGADDALNDEDVESALNRHHKGDWGDLCDRDRRRNALALQHGRRLWSVYRDRFNTKFYIITEANRRVTTILLPEEC